MLIWAILGNALRGWMARMAVVATWNLQLTGFHDPWDGSNPTLTANLLSDSSENSGRLHVPTQNQPARISRSQKFAKYFRRLTTLESITPTHHRPSPGEKL
jgi:hypothetical protein